MKPIAFILTFLLVSYFLISKPKSFLHAYQNAKQVDSSNVKLIDKKKLRQLCKNTNAQITWVAIYTNGCDGTQYLLKDVANLTKVYQDSLQVLLCSSEPYNEIRRMQKVLKRYEVNLSPVYMIDSIVYKDDREDDREKGFAFRKDICKPCRKDIIGVPYSIFFNKKGEVVYYGYPSKTNIDSFLNAYIK